MKNLHGMRFGRLTVICEEPHRDTHRNRLWVCRCDCGGETIQRTNTLMMGLVQSCGCLKREIAASRTNDKNVNWKGDRVGLASIHSWVRSRKPMPAFCEDCKEKEPYDLANISGKYLRDVNDFKWLCRKCHMIFDDRLGRRRKNGQFERLCLLALGVDQPL